MRSFPLFTELEEKRDKINAAFHKNVEPQLIERLHEFGFKQISADFPARMALVEQATNNIYHLSINRYNIIIQFEHVRSGELQLICEISNFEMNAHNIMDLIVKCVDCWLQYGVVFDYMGAQGFEVE